MTVINLSLFILCMWFLSCKGDLSLTSTALTQERQYYQATVDNAVQVVLRKLSKDKEIASGSRVSKVDLEDTQVAESILYSVGVQMDIGRALGVAYNLQFVQPLSSWRPLRTASALPAGRTLRRSSTELALLGSSPSYAPPEISLTLNGPLELYFPHATTELSIKTPRYVDVGFVERIILKEGANITLSGSVELRLRESLSIDTAISVENNRLVIDTEDKPKLNVYGHRIAIINAPGEGLKVQKKFSSVVEISPLADTVVKTGRVSLGLPLNDSRVETIKYALQKLSESANVPSLPKVRQLTSGTSMEAVVSFLIPLEVEDEQAGTSTMWDVVMVQGSNHKEAQVISVERQKVRNEVTFAQEVVGNGTLPSLIADFNRYLQASDRML